METKDWREFLKLYEKNYGDKNKTIEKFGIDHKQFNLWYYTNKEFGESCNRIESMRNQTIEDEIYLILEQEFENYQEQGYTFKDCVSLTGFDPIKHHQKLSSETKYSYSKPPEFWDKYIIKFDPSNPKERLDWEIEYRKKLLKLRESRFDRNEVRNDKRKQKRDELRSRLNEQNPSHPILNTNDEIIDWEVEKIKKRTDKKIKDLQNRIKKGELLEDERKKSRDLQQTEYKKLVKEKEKGRIERFDDIEKKKTERSELREDERKKRELEKQRIYEEGLEERTKQRLEREKLKEEVKYQKYFSRLQSKNKSVKIKIDSKDLLDKLKKEIIQQVVPDGILDKVKNSNEYGTKLYDVDNKVIFQKCPGCDEYKDRTHFHRKGKKDLVQYCIPCTRVRMGLDPDGGKRGETYKGRIIKKYNKNKNETHRRCTSCDKFHPTNDFRYKYRTSNVCKGCYIKLPNNTLTRMGEFNSDNIQIRWYDEKTYLVTHKKCNFCDTKKSKDEFTMRTKTIDGLSNRCKPCEKWVRDYKKQDSSPTKPQPLPKTQLNPIQQILLKRDGDDLVINSSLINVKKKDL